MSVWRRLVGSYAVLALLLLAYTSPAGTFSGFQIMEKSDAGPLDSTLEGWQESQIGIEDDGNEASEENIHEELTSVTDTQAPGPLEDSTEDDTRYDVDTQPIGVPAPRTAIVDIYGRKSIGDAISPPKPIPDNPPIGGETVRDGSCGILKSFTNKTHLREYVLKNTEEVEDNLWEIVQRIGIMVPGSGLLLTQGGLDSPGYDHSETNNQVAGVDEPDIVKTDGEFLYVLTGEKVVILNAYPGGAAKVISTIEVGNGAEEIFITSNRLVVFQDTYKWTSIKTYDITARMQPKLIQNVTVDGRYFDSRLIGNHVYVIIRDYVIIHKDRELELPSIITNGESKALSASEICFFDEPAPSYGIALILSIDLEDQEVRYKAYLIDGTTATYVSVNNIYITGVNYSNIYLNWIDWWWEEETIIHKISIDQGSITYKARGDVSGWVLNQFSMDEFKGYFRIATTIGHAWAGRTSESNVYVMNGNLEIIGELTGLGKGEEIYSARFMATRCYLVTFEKIDPFYVIDLSDQTNPTVLGELKLPGYSDYLHPYDVNHVIGLGKDAIDMGEFSWFQGVKLSLFDVTDLANPIEISNYSIGDRGTTSEALYTHKAFLFSKSKDLLVIPIRLYEIDESKYPGEIPPNAYGDFIWQGAYVFSVTTDDGFVLKGRISHLDHFPDFEENPHKYAKYFVKRSLYIEDEILTVSEKMVKIHQLDTLAHVKTVEL